MSDYLRNKNSFLEHIADEDDFSVLAAEESQESPSFCELVVKENYDKFKYSHPNDTDDFKHSAAENYLKHGKSLPVVFAMAIGHNNFLTLTEKSPFTMTTKKIHTQVFKPSNSVLAKEVVRRAHFLFHDKKYDDNKEDHPLYNRNKKRIIMPKPSGYTREQLMEFLVSKTIKLEAMDTAFMFAQIYLYSKSLTKELNSQNLKPDATSWDRGSWEGIVPNVRLIEIALSDEFRVDFLHRNDAESRQQLDARGTESQKLSFWEKV
jgi:hypothetical protein